MNLRKIVLTAILSAGLCFIGHADKIVKSYAHEGLSHAEALTLSTNENSISASMFLNNSENLVADFTCIKEGASQTAWSENFDNGSADWTLNNAESFSWELKKTSGNKAFSTIDANDVQSLFIEGHYRFANRGTASAVSPKITIPRNATFSGYVGYSRNFNEDCTLTLFISTDGSNWTKLWTSTDDQGERPWMWRKFDISLAEYNGVEAQFKFEYGNHASYDNAGYMGDFAIDGLEIKGAAAVENISVKTGETVSFADNSTGNVTSWSWNFPGGTPETSTEQNPKVYYTRDGQYDVSLTISDGTNQSTKTIENFVTVTGVAPVAKIVTPATFRYSNTRLPMVAPLADVQYKDASEGFPTSWQWDFTGTEPEHMALGTSNEPNPVVSYDFLHQQTVMLTVKNQHGTSEATANVSVEYEGFINNIMPDDYLTTFDLGNGYGEFPGTNKLGITEYAEKFSKPSRPVVVYGAKVYFTNAIANALTDQIADVSVSICKSENGVPGEKLQSTSWRVFELDTPSGTSLVGTDFEFSTPVNINEEFFIKVEGIPEKNDSCKVSFAMANFRGEGNTAYFYRDKKWTPASEYFPAGKNHTSFAVSPYIVHSVIAPLENPEISVSKEAGQVTLPLFSLMGYETPVVSDAEWCKVIGKPNGLTVDTLNIAYEALPEDIESRIANITVTDGLSEFKIKVTQNRENSSVATVVADDFCVYPTIVENEMTVKLPAEATDIDIFSATGNHLFHQDKPEAETVIDCSAFPNGMLIVRAGTTNGDRVTKAIKR